MTLWPEPGPSPLAEAFDEANGPVSIEVVLFQTDGSVRVMGSGTDETYSAEQWAEIDGRGPGEIPPLLNIPRPRLNVRFVKAYSGVDFDHV